MDSIRLQNFRSLVDTGAVPIKPITLLVGANSTGKSSLLRVFPLLKQSIETATATPLLWYGRYVDFGSLQDVVHKKASTGPVTLHFTFGIAPFDPPGWYPQSPVFNPLEPTSVTVSLSLVSAASTQGEAQTRIASCSITIGEHEINLAFSDSGRVTSLRVDDTDALGPDALLSWSGGAHLIPSVAELEADQDERELVFQPYLVAESRPRTLFRSRAYADSLWNSLHNELATLFHGNAGPDTIHHVSLGLRFGRPQAMLTHMLTLPGGAYWEARIKELTPNSSKLRRITSRLLAAHVPIILTLADQHVAGFAAGVSYMGPLRATAQRYYRAQELAVREVDFRGDNLAMFLRSLNRAERRAFSEFSQQYFGFDVSGATEGGHVIIRLKEHGSPTETNLADMGFGYSQVLPVVAQIWASCARGRVRPTKAPSETFIALEQPELHLHPAFQARLADMLVGSIAAARGLGSSLATMVETHSEAIVNRLGDLINRGRIRADDVQIAVFEQDREAQRSRVSFAGYDSSGALNKWPYGFFAPDPELD